jgi:UDP-2,4-diacetamido-2,4,6-trideoxy-beta-L-altropyranose hydrolase
MAQRAVFRCDAGRSIGTGHFVRCLALAEALVERGWSCLFLSLPGSRAALAHNVPFPAEIIEAHAVDDPRTVRSLVPHGCDLFVLDSYRLGIQHETALDGWCGTSLVFDDRPFRRHAASLLLDPTLGRTPETYAPLLSGNTRLLLGPAYALLPADFAEARPRALARRAAEGGPPKILMALGSSCGARSALEIALEACRISGLIGEIHVVAPEAWPLPVESGRMRIIAHGPAPQMYRLMTACDIAIGVAGASAWERCCLGLPTILLRLGDSQADTAEALAETGAVIDFGTSVALSAELIAHGLQGLADNPSRRRDLAMRAAIICDGRGTRRVASVLSPWCARDGEAVTLRPATRRDAGLMFQWQQAPAVRRYLPNPELQSWETYLGWLESRLGDAEAGPFSIIVKSGRDVGVLRLDPFAPQVRGRLLEPNALRIGIHLEANSRDRGVGTAALQAARFLEPQAPFYAKAVPGDAASHRVFERAGYQEVGPGLYRQMPALADGPDAAAACG